MEEVDKIIIHSLQEIDSNFDDIPPLKNWDTDLIVRAVTTCLNIINSEGQFTKTLPPNMGARYRICQELAQACQNLKYPGELGYQTFLYAGEGDVRKLLMFLIEKLPKEDNVFVQELSSSQILLNKMRLKVGTELSRGWLPYELSFKNSSNFGNYSLSGHLQEEWKQFSTKDLPLQDIRWKHIIPTVITLHSRGIVYKKHSNLFGTASEFKPEIKPKPQIRRKPILAPKPKPRSIIGTVEDTIEKIEEPEFNEIEVLLQEIQSLKIHKNKIEQEIIEGEKKLNQEQEKNVIQSKLSEVFQDGEQGINKLQNAVDAASQKLISLATQWENHRKPLIDQYREQMRLYSNKQDQSVIKIDLLKTLAVKRKELEAELKSKDQLFDQLTINRGKLNKEVKRGVYTRRILEIIGNIEKQKIEIEKVLNDTRELQYDINVLSGQVSRSFALADETVFRDARRDESCRKMYKLVAALHTDCGDIVQMVEETGAYLREIKELEDQIENQKGKDVSGKLERITADLNQMQQESSQLSLQITRLQSIRNS